MAAGMFIRAARMSVDGGAVVVAPRQRYVISAGDDDNDAETFVKDETFHRDVLVYSVVVPAICLCGIVGNVAILLVLRRRALKESTYTYLTVLAAADLASCVLLFFSGLARGAFWKRHGWLEYDLFVYIPVATISSNVAVLAAIGVTIDRLLVVVRSAPTQPSFCTKTVARRAMCCCVFLVVLVDAPFFFIYTYDEDGDIVAKKLSDTFIFAVLNWMQLVMFGLIPALFLLIGNGIMIISVNRTMRQRQLLLRCRQTKAGRYLQDQSKLTITLVGIVFLFLVGEIPMHLTSRRSAVSILYGGDPSKVDKSVMEIFRLIATILGAVSFSANFVMYCLLNPKFLSNMKALFKKQDGSRDILMRVATIKGTMQSEDSLPSRVSSGKTHCPWKF